MARIELSNIGGGGTTLSLTTTGTSGASTLAGSVLNIPIYQGQLTLTTTGTSGAATLSGTTLNIPQYSGGGGGTPAGSAGEVQFNSTPAGAFAASANLAWDNSNVRFNIGAPPTPNSRLNIKGSGATGSTSPLTITNSSNVENFRFFDNSVFRIGNSSVINSATVEVNSGLDSFIKTIIFKAQGNSTTAVDIRAAGTSTGFPSVNMYDTEAGSSGNAMFIGRGPWSLPSTGVTFIGNLVPGTANAASQHFGFMVSSVALGRFQAMQIFSSGNVILQNAGTYTDNGYKLDIISASSTHALRVRAPNASGGTNALLVQNTTVSDLYKIEANGKITYLATNTAAGTTGPQTIDRPSGTVNFAIGASALVVTNSLCTTSSIVFATVRTNDATAYIKNVVPAGGSFTINLGANATAETSVGFFIIN